jgi:hypothetical protein
MDRQAILDKIAAMLRLQESSGFDGESAAAAAMIDKLCAKYGVTVNEATTPQVHSEIFETYKKLDEACFVLFGAVASFYDGLGFVSYDKSQGRRISKLKCIGTEAQQIQTRLYYDFLKSCMIRECEIAIQGEKALSSILGTTYNAYGFRSNFCKAFAVKVRARLIEMKATREPHEHKEFTAIEVAKMRFKDHKLGGSNGLGGQIGANAGANASLHRQTSGSQTRALCGAR